ncbi:MAG: CDP-diacylglycerol--glycerol-3-phosphate 3-phosphatidyltransferase [Christensenellaceae bacterium]|nr:CDP-diacylglycerol--glycerol-3-phosphate 3-phosphatidyltransferase [Christensenellaceae bacterium]
MSDRWKNIFNIPNTLTVLRLLLIPVFSYYIQNNNMKLAFVFFFLAGLTDVVDGYIARKFNQITWVGKLLDPFADKLMVVALMLNFFKKDIIPSVAFYIILVKEFLMVTSSLYLLSKDKVVHSKHIGKLAQFTIFTALILCFFHKYFDNIGIQIHLILLWIGVVLSVCAFFYYARSIYFLEFKKDKVN